MYDVADLVDIRLHRHGGVDHQHHRGAEGVGVGAEHTGGRFGGSSTPGVDGRYVKQLHRLAVFIEALLGVEDRQQVKLVLRDRAGRRLKRQHLLIVFAVLLRLGQGGFRGSGIRQQFFHLRGLAQEHHRRTARALGELEHQALLPVADLSGRQPAIAAPIGGGTDTHPRAAIDVFALVNVEHGKRRQRLVGRTTGVMGQLGAGLAEHPLKQGLFAGHQQRPLAAIHIRHGRFYRGRWRRRGRRCFRNYGGGRCRRRIAAAQPPVTGTANRQRHRHRDCSQRQHRPSALFGHGVVLRRCHHWLAHRLWLRLFSRNLDGHRRHTRQIKTQRNRQRPHQRRFRRVRRQLIQGPQQRRRIRETLGRVLGQQLTQHILITAVVHRQLRQRLGQVSQRGGECIGAGVGQLADKDFIEHHAQRVQVGAAIDLLAARLLRAHVARRAHGKSGLGELGTVVQRLGDTEVRQHRGAVGAEQNIRRFDVAVHQPLGMRIAQGRGDLADQGHALLRRQPGSDTLFERAVGQVLHGHVIQLTDIADVMDGHRVRVGQARQGLALAQETLAKTRISRQRRRHHLQRHLALQRALGRQVHAGHGAFADLAFDVITRNHDVHGETFTTMAVMLSGAPRLSPRCTRLRTISSGASWLRTSRISWSSTVLFRPSLHSR